MRKTIMSCTFALAIVFPLLVQAREACELRDKERLPDPGTLTMAASAPTRSQNVVSVYQCITSVNTLTCFAVFTRNERGSADYTITPQWLAQATLFDNFKEPHKLSKAYYCNGREKPVQTINLTQKDWVWIVLEFDGGADDINHGRIISPNDNGGGGTLELNAPVLKRF